MNKFPDMEGLKKGWALAKLKKNPKNNLICCLCGTNFYRRGNRKFKFKFCTCSKQCKNKYQSKVLTGRIGPKRGLFSSCLECKKQIYSYPSRMRHFCSLECRNNNSSFFKRGELHYAWKGGVKQNRMKDFNLRRWQRLLRKSNGRMCNLCGAKDGIMCADHILPWADFPEYRYSLLNGQILCKSCHDVKTKIENKNRNGKKFLTDKYKEKIYDSFCKANRMV